MRDTHTRTAPAPSADRADELQLMERVRANDVSALDALMSLYWRPLIVYALEIVGSIDAAEMWCRTCSSGLVAAERMAAARLGPLVPVPHRAATAR